MKTNILFILLIFSFIVEAISSNHNIRINEDIVLIEISEGFYMHQTFDSTAEHGRFASNGMLVIKNGKALLIDTPVTNETTSKMVTYLKDSMGVQTVLFIGGHSHIDCIGGMQYLKNIGVKTILNERTESKCKELNLPLPDTTFDKYYFFKFEEIPVECRFVGGGHTVDNIVVYFPDQKILFGGCLVKSVPSNNLGNLNDAVVGEWKETIQRIIGLYPSIRYIIPGHGDLGGNNLLYHTIDLVDKYQKQ